MQTYRPSVTDRRTDRPSVTAYSPMINMELGYLVEAYTNPVCICLAL